MGKQTIIGILFFYVTVLNSQTNIFNNWHFGDHASITFNTNPPSFVGGSVINTMESCGSISDSNGVLLFYTNGVKVYNKNHIQMPNGFGLNGHISTTQGAFITPYPKHPNLYYIFTMDAQDGTTSSPGCACLSYSIVDMSLLGGLGNIISKNNVLFPHVTEKMSGYFATDTSLWIVAHEWNSNKFLSYFISPSGLNTIPIISSIGFSHCCDLAKINSIGQMKISQDGKKLGYTLQKDRRVEILDFDKTTGIISNPVSFILPYEYTFGFEFSPNSQYIYLTSSLVLNSYLLQYNISNWDSLSIKGSEQVLEHNSTGTYSQLQLGIDGKIYVIEGNEYYLSVINSPNQSGFSCNFTKRSFPLSDGVNSGQSKVGLPNVIWGYGSGKSQFVYSDTLCEPIIPNVITPNNDLVNDEFKITCNLKNYIPEDLIIYNRWGQEVFNTRNKINQLSSCNDGTYFYAFTINDKKYSGFVSLFH